MREFTAQRDVPAQFGCPLDGLCSELEKRTAQPRLAAGQLMSLPIGWAEAQFRSLGQRDAHELAVRLLAVYEGSALLANTLHDPDVLATAARRLDRWIDSL